MCNRHFTGKKQHLNQVVLTQDISFVNTFAESNIQGLLQTVGGGRLVLCDGPICWWEVGIM